MTISSSAAHPTVDAVLDILSTAEDRELGEIVELAASICGVGAAAITIRRGEQYHLPITHGMKPMVCRYEETFCALTMGVDGLFVIEDTRSDERTASLEVLDERLAATRLYASAPIHDPAGTMVGRLCVASEEPGKLTDLQVQALETLGLSVSKLIELRLLQAARKAALTPPTNTSALVSQLTLERNHDLKVPLAGIVAALEMVRDRESLEQDPYAALLLERCSSAAWRMNRMLERDLTDAASAGAHLGRTDLAQVVRHVLDGTATLLERAGAVVEVGDLPVVRADPDATYSIVQNLVTNAVKFARPGVLPLIRVTASPADDDWRIAVCDNGVGIPEGLRSDVFSLFGRARTDVEGHGVGLATVARIVTLHGGRFGAEESDAGGAEIWFTLPRA